MGARFPGVPGTSGSLLETAEGAVEGELGGRCLRLDGAALAPPQGEGDGAAGGAAGRCGATGGRYRLRDQVLPVHRLQPSGCQRLLASACPDSTEGNFLFTILLAEDVATGLLMRPNRSKQLSRSGCVLRRARVYHLTLLTYVLSNTCCCVSPALNDYRRRST